MGRAKLPLPAGNKAELSICFSWSVWGLVCQAKKGGARHSNRFPQSPFIPPQTSSQGVGGLLIRSTVRDNLLKVSCGAHLQRRLNPSHHDPYVGCSKLRSGRDSQLPWEAFSGWIEAQIGGGEARSLCGMISGTVRRWKDHVLCWGYCRQEALLLGLSL